MAVFIQLFLAFLKKYWPYIAIVLLLIGLYVGYKYHEARMTGLENQIQSLKTEIVLKDGALKNRDNIIEIQNRAMDIVNFVQEQEKVAEHHYHEKIIENKEVVKEYLDNPDDPEAKKKFYDYKNEQWKGISQMEWFEENK